MARKPTLRLEHLASLGAEKLTALVLEEAAGNAGFKRRLNAALAGQSGPEAIAKLIDRRLAGLERARSFIDWDKIRPFRDDLKGLLGSILGELGPVDPALAADRLLRFIATHGQVFERIDDSSGHVQDVYHAAIEGLGVVAGTLSEPDGDALPGLVMARLGDTEHGYLTQVAAQVVLHLSRPALTRWDSDLAEQIVERHLAEAGQRAGGQWFYSMTSQWREIRQAIAGSLGDLDQLIGLEMEKPERLRETLGIAAQLLEAGRAEEALDWVRRGPGITPRVPGADDDAEDDPAVLQAGLEARILTALGRKQEAGTVLWSRFAETLSPDLLRQHLKSLPDFEDIEAEERALTMAAGHPKAMVALRFFLAWARLDLAAQLIIARHGLWDGRDWHVLPEVADLLQHDHPLAASILYRALLDDILARARSKAYPHGAKYLRLLEGLAVSADADPARPDGMTLHTAYREKLRADHGRKAGFWSLVDGKLPSAAPEPVFGRRPRWISTGD